MPAALRPAPVAEASSESTSAARCLLAPIPSPAVIRLSGKDRLDFVHRLSTNDLLGLSPGQGCFTAFLSTRGRIVDLALALALDDELMLVSSPGNAERIRALLDGYLFREDVILKPDSTTTCGILFGPDAAAVLSRVAAGRWEQLATGDHSPTRIGQADARVARALPLGGTAYLVLFQDSLAGEVEAALAASGAAAASPGMVHRHRVEAMIPALGSELSEEFNPWEISLDRAIRLDKGCYLGQEVVARLHNFRKVQRRLAGLELDAAPPDPPAPIFCGEESVGTLTSAAPSPEGGRWLGLGIVQAARCLPGVELRVGASGSQVAGRIRDAAPPLAASLRGPF